MLIVSLILTISASVGSATLEWEILSTLKLDTPPLDMAVAPDGKSVYILTHNGEIQVYDLDGTSKIRFKSINRLIRLNSVPAETFCL